MWIATNKGGHVYGYSTRPDRTPWGWTLVESVGREIFLGMGNEAHWEDSLEERPAEFAASETVSYNLKSISVHNPYVVVEDYLLAVIKQQSSKILELTQENRKLSNG